MWAMLRGHALYFCKERKDAANVSVHWRGVLYCRETDGESYRFFVKLSFETRSDEKQRYSGSKWGMMIQKKGQKEKNKLVLVDPNH